MTASTLLRRMGITHIVVHAETPRQVRMLARWEERLGTGPEREVERVYAEPGISIYRVLLGGNTDEQGPTRTSTDVRILVLIVRELSLIVPVRPCSPPSPGTFRGFQR